ncbi:MAG TPA: hypothetical protein VMZ22_11105 [Acidimicrobiales bacterium]|nr:hypothetical protein [Acidimicrobiales bacterium]
MIESASLYLTAVFLVTALAALPLSAARGIAGVVAVGLFLAGTVMMAAALVIAVGRSRFETIEIGNLFFGQAPRPLKAALVAQTVIGLATAAARPYTSSALGVLVPVLGLGCCGLWAARHGQFPPKEA